MADGGENGPGELESTPIPTIKRRKYNMPFRSPLLSNSKDNQTPNRNTPLRVGLHRQLSSTGSHNNSPTEHGEQQQATLPTKDRVSKSSTNGGRQNLRRKFQSPLLKTQNKNLTSSKEDPTPSNKALQDATEELRRLKLLEYHKKHNDLDTLNSITRRWADAGHKAIHELRDSLDQNPKPGISELLTMMRIPTDHISCNCSENIDDD